MDIIKGSSCTIAGVVYTNWTGDVSTSTLATPGQMTGATVKFYVKQRDGDSDANAVLNIAGIVLDVNAASININIAASDTNNLSYQNLVFETVVKLSDGTYHRSGSQPFVIKPNVGKTLF